jgi:hypothetical protein
MCESRSDKVQQASMKNNEISMKSENPGAKPR